MWIQTQNLREILEVKHIKVLPVDDDVRVLAKLDRETVTLGIYPKEQVESVVEDLKEFIRFKEGMGLYVMPKEWEDEDE